VHSQGEHQQHTRASTSLQHLCRCSTRKVNFALHTPLTSRAHVQLPWLQCTKGYHGVSELADWTSLAEAVAESVTSELPELIQSSSASVEVHRSALSTDFIDPVQ
jgi:hypothetical protein